MDVRTWLSSLCLLIVLKLTSGLNKDLSCAVCRALVDEVNYSIGLVDPKKTIQVGSFRVDSRGNQGTYEKPYARSEVHLIEIFESVCGNMRDYAESTNEAGQPSVARTKSRHGKPMSLKNIKISAETNKALKHKCESIVEDYEDEMVAIFRLHPDDVPNLEKAICAEIAAQCTNDQLSIPMPVTEVESIEIDTTEQTDDPKQVMDEYLKDNADSIPADFVVEPDSTEIHDREEL